KQICLHAEALHFITHIVGHLHIVDRIIQMGTADFECKPHPLFQARRAVNGQRDVFPSLMGTGGKKSRQTVNMITVQMCDENMPHFCWTHGRMEYTVLYAFCCIDQKVLVYLLHDVEDVTLRIPGP